MLRFATWIEHSEWREGGGAGLRGYTCDPETDHVAMGKKQPHVWKVGDKVMRQGKPWTTYEITRVSPDGSDVDLCLVGTNFELFRVRTDLLTPAKEVA